MITHHPRSIMGPMINGARFVLLEPGTGLVLSQRGPDGGFSLARPASDISLAEIVDGSARSDGRSRGGQGWLQTGHKPDPRRRLAVTHGRRRVVGWTSTDLCCSGGALRSPLRSSSIRWPWTTTTMLAPSAPVAIK
jgi:hypothetical protein